MMNSTETLIQKSQLFSEKGKERLIKAMQNVSNKEQEKIRNILMKEQILRNNNSTIFLNTMTEKLRKKRFTYLELLDQKKLEEIETMIEKL